MAASFIQAEGIQGEQKEGMLVLNTLPTNAVIQPMQMNSRERVDKRKKGATLICVTPCFFYGEAEGIRTPDLLSARRILRFILVLIILYKL